MHKIFSFNFPFIFLNLKKIKCKEFVYHNTLFISGSFFPSVITVLDDEDSNNITAGSIVTVTVTLTRKRMAVRMITCCFFFFYTQIESILRYQKIITSNEMNVLSCCLEVWLVFSDDH